MVKRNKPLVLAQRFISALLSLSMISSILVGCSTALVAGIKPSSAAPAVRLSQQETLRAAEFLTSAYQLDQQVFLELPETDSVVHPWDDNIGNIEMFVYGLLVSQYQNLYEVFNGMITLPDGSEIYGIGFTDFDSYFEADNGFGFFSAGFIPLIGEPDVPEELIESGLEIVDVDQMDINLSFVLAYDVEPFLQHCVIWNQYLQYGIDENGRITYTAEDYFRGHCNEELGALYSYDEKRFVFDPNVGTYQYIAGQSLYAWIDYASLEAEVNRILEQQDFNFSIVEVRTAVYTAQEAYTNYLLSLQEESFMGYPVKDLVELAEQLDPMEMIRFTPEGHVIINITDDIPDTAEGLTKWLTGIWIGITAVCFVAPMIMPALAPFAGAIAMASCNVFSQILDENRGLSDINWTSVALSAVTGAMVAWAIPTMSGNVTYNLIQQGIGEGASKLAGYTLQGFSNGMVHGITDAVSELVEGNKIGDAWDTFVISAAQTAAITLAFSGVFELLNPAIDSVVGNISSDLQKIITENPNGWLSNLAKKIGDLNIHQIHFENEALDRFLTPRSVYEAAKVSTQDLHIQSAFKDETYKHLPNNDNFDYLDENGQLLSKDQIDIDNMNFYISPSDSCSPEIYDYFAERGVVALPVVNGQVDFSSVSNYTFIPEAGIGSNRDVNFRAFYKQLADEWRDDPTKIPPQIRELLTETELENLTRTIVKRVISEAKMTFHEGADGAVYLVDRIAHKNIGHAGGVFMAKLRETITAGVDYLQWLIYGVEPAVIDTTVS